jgi:hypothetical protein
VPNPRRGDVYAARAWVKAGTAGRQMRLIVREQGGASATQSTVGAPVTLGTGWQQLSVSRTVARADRVSLDVYVSMSGAAAGDAFLVDNLALSLSTVAQSTPTPTPTQAPVATVTPLNLVRNPSFEADVSGWYGWQSALSRVSGGEAGTSAARVALACPAGVACSSYSIDDAPSTVASPRQGEVFTATAWVKAGTIGRQVSLVLRESGGATASESSRSAAVTLTSGWQELSITRAIARADRNSLEVYASQGAAASGDTFLVDNVSVTRQS